MKYYFVVKLHNIKLDAVLRRGKVLSQNTRISNSTKNFKRFFENDTFIYNFGTLEFNDLIDSVYIYEIGDFLELKGLFKSETDNIQLINFLLRKVQVFLTCLWLVKDNSVTFEVGFMQVYDKNPYKGTVTSNSLSNMPFTSGGEKVCTTFSEEELELAIHYYNKFTLNTDNFFEEKKLVLKNPLPKGSKRIERAMYFLNKARDASALPIKVIDYCTILECLFTNDSHEVTHKVSERFSFFLGKNSEERKELFKTVKKLYKIRSKAVHGQAVRESPDEMRRLLGVIDEKIREIFILEFAGDEKCKVFDMNNEDYENWFLELILK